MDDLLPHLLSFPPHPPPPQPLPDDDYDRQIQSLLQVLNQTPASRLTGKITGGGDLLDVSLLAIIDLLSDLLTALDYLGSWTLTFHYICRSLTLRSTHSHIYILSSPTSMLFREPPASRQAMQTQRWCYLPQHYGQR